MQSVHPKLTPVVAGPWQDAPLPTYGSEEAALVGEDCNDAVHFFYPDRLRAAAQRFVAGFRGKSVYAVKANPADAFLMEAWRSGVRSFDVASLREVETLTRLLPDAELHYMHPVKSRQAIRKAYAYGVRSFAFDCRDELEKIREETDSAQDLTLFLRVSVQVEGAAYALEGKFGASLAEAPGLLRLAARRGAKTGLCFHVGSQCMDPTAYRTAIEQMAAIVQSAGIRPDILDVGGGFPVRYPGMDAAPLETYFDVIHQAVVDHGFGDTALICEPGRALVAEAGATAARVELRKGDALYLNDGTYGALFDAGTPKWPFAVRLLRTEGRAPAGMIQNFKAFGPTCDSIDEMQGPFPLPADAEEGDWVVFENLGSYGQTMQSRFNGFYSETLVAIQNETPVALHALPASEPAETPPAPKPDTPPMVPPVAEAGGLNPRMLTSDFLIVSECPAAAAALSANLPKLLPAGLRANIGPARGCTRRVRIKGLGEAASETLAAALRHSPSVKQVMLEQILAV